MSFFTIINQLLKPHYCNHIYKLLHIYSECIITAEEFVALCQAAFAKPIYRLPEENNAKTQEYLNTLLQMTLVKYREFNRKKYTMFKPLSDQDFSTTLRTTHSYVAMPKIYPSYSSKEDEIAKAILNREIVSVPRGSEHTSFLIMRKNQYEEALFKSEDEKFEYDMMLQFYQRSIRLLQAIQKTEDRASQLKLMNECMNFKVVQNLYRMGSKESEQILEYFKQEPRKIADLLLRRMEDKFREIQEVRNATARKQWHEIAEKNFHRSLDHRSFYFKKNDKKLCTREAFEKDPEARYLSLLGVQPSSSSSEQKEAIVYDISSFYTKIENTFSGLTNFEKCDHHEVEAFLEDFDFAVMEEAISAPESLELKKQNSVLTMCGFSMKNKDQHKINYILKKGSDNNYEVPWNIPIMILAFEKADIAQDAFSLLMAYLPYCGSNQAERDRREKMKKLLPCILTGIFNIKYRDIEVLEHYNSEQYIMQQASRIENTIFTKNYTNISAQQQYIANNAPGSNGFTEGTNEDDAQNQAHDGSRSQATHDFQEQDLTQDIQDVLVETKALLYQQMEELEAKQRSAEGGSGVASENNEGNEGRGAQNSGRAPHGSAQNLELEEGQEEQALSRQLKKMAYHNQQQSKLKFLPRLQKGRNTVFYGSKNIYVLMRFFYVLYERLLRAHEIAYTFEDSEKVAKLSKEERDKISRDRYQLFKLIILNSFKVKEQTKGEDYLRCLFGKSAYLLFTVDKLLQNIFKFLQVMASDQLSAKLIEEYVDTHTLQKKQIFEQFKWIEDPYYSKVNHLSMEHTNDPLQRNLIRFTINEDKSIVYINYFYTLYYDWQTEPLNDTSTYYHNFALATSPPNANQARTSTNLVYLNRNKLRGHDNPTHCFCQNNIEYMTEPNSSKLHNSNQKKEDLLINGARLLKRKNKTDLEEQINREYKKICKI